MVDFKKIMEKMEAEMSPEQKERVRLHREKEEKFNTTALETSGIWIWKNNIKRPPEKLRFNKSPSKDVYETVTSSVEEKPITIRIEERGDNEKRSVIKFIGDMVTDTAYHLDEHFYKELYEKNSPEWHLCAGTPGRYPTIKINTDVIKEYLEKFVPEYIASKGKSDPLDEVFKPEEPAFKM